ncbi:MAG: DUF3352 domain-containing protein, partial [Chloroflexi bacterium]|nr:DUF3352 domain-containing protein [Chloroflexota bacterium]
VLLVVVIGAAAAAIANRTAQGQADATTRVMPANTMFYASLNTHTDQLPNFNVIADAWKDSKEAKMLASGLELAFTQAGLSWEEDVQPWLGDRVAVGLVDLGGMEEARADGDFNYRTPFFLVAAQTKDRAKSDEVLANLRKQLESKIEPNGFITTTVGDETHRGIPLVYMTTEYSSFMSETPSQPQDTLAYATVDDMIVVTSSRAQLHQIIDAALDGRNLSASENFKTVMSTLPDQNAGVLYMDYGQLMPAYFDMITGVSTNAPIFLLCEYEAKSKDATPDTDCVKQRQEEEQRRAEQQRQLEEQMQELRDMLQAIGGVGMVMSYEPTGVRFDMAAQYDIDKMPEDMRAAYANQTPASGRVFASIPASAIAAVNLNLQNAQWDQAFDLDQYAMQLEQMDVTKEEALAKLAELQKLIGVDLKTDLLDLLKGEAAFIMLPKAEQTQSEFGFSLPFQFAAMFESSDAAKAASSLDKVVQAVSALTGEDSVKWQSLSGLPYSVVLDPDGAPMLTYGVVDGRLVIGTDSDTLLAIDNAEQAPLSNDALFKQAGLQKGQILLVTDGVNVDKALPEVKALDGYTLSILGVGTADGAPIALPEGGFLKDEQGTIVIPKL